MWEGIIGDQIIRREALALHSRLAGNPSWQILRITPDEVPLKQSSRSSPPFVQAPLPRPNLLTYRTPEQTQQDAEATGEVRGKESLCRAVTLLPKSLDA
jgi:hypothetical protein